MGMTQEAAQARRDYKRKYRIENRDKINARQREWRANNPEKVRQYNEKYWAKVAAKGRNPRFSSWADYGIDKHHLAKLQEMIRSGRYDDIVRDAAYMADEQIAEYILLSVMKNKSYDALKVKWELKEMEQMPCCRTDFYAIRRKFYHHLDCLLK